MKAILYEAVRRYVLTGGVIVFGLCSTVEAYIYPDPNVVPLGDTQQMYFSNVSSTNPIGGMEPMPVRLENNMGTDTQLRFPEMYLPYGNIYPIPLREALAIASEQQTVILFPSYQPQMQDWSPSYPYSGVYTSIGPASWKRYVYSILANLSQPPPGTFLQPADLAVRGAVSVVTNANPTATTALAANPIESQKICWKQPVTLYAAYGNGLNTLADASSGPEGPGPNPDHQTFRLPEDYCEAITIFHF